jgi:major membrane immunogen (membrane-anchored lipoprotein)
MKKLTNILTLLVTLFLLSNCSSTNKYMVSGTNEYQEVTSKLIGTGAVTQYRVDGTNLLKSKYEKMTASFDFSTRTAKFTIWVAEGKISDKLLDWKEKFPGIKVDEYKITYTAEWSVSEDGKNLKLMNPETDLVIKGSGENFEGFYAWEKSKFNMAKASDDGSLLGSALGSLTKAATNTGDLFPEFSEEYKININGRVIVLSDGNNRIKIKK